MDMNNDYYGFIPDIESINLAQKIINNGNSEEKDNSNCDSDADDIYYDLDDSNDNEIYQLDSTPFDIEELIEDFKNLSDDNNRERNYKQQKYNKIIQIITNTADKDSIKIYIDSMLTVLDLESSSEYLENFMNDMQELKYLPQLIENVLTTDKVPLISRMIELGYAKYFKKYYKQYYNSISLCAFEELYSENIITNELLIETFLEACKNNNKDYVENVVEIIGDSTNFCYSDTYSQGIYLSAKKSHDVLLYLLEKSIEFTDDSSYEYIKKTLLKLFEESILEKNKMTLKILCAFIFETNITIGLQKLLNITENINNENYSDIIDNMFMSSDIEKNAMKEYIKEYIKEYDKISDQSISYHVDIIKNSIAENNLLKTKFILRKIKLNIKSNDEYHEILNDLIIEAYSRNNSEFGEFFTKKMKASLDNQ